MYLETPSVKKERNERNIFMSYNEIISSIEEKAIEMRKKYIGHEDKYVFIIILKGGLHFFYEFYKYLGLDINYVFIKMENYWENAQKNKKVKILQYTKDQEIKNKIPIIIDDIVDTGRAVDVTTKWLNKKFKPKKIEGLFFLIRYVDEFVTNIKYDYVKEINSEKWIAGWGFDNNQKERYLKYIYFVN